MDFYHIGAMKVFSQLGQLIEDDERNQIKLSDLPSEVMEQIGSYLLEDKRYLEIDQMMNYKYCYLVR